jgi:hypothetical protein
MAKIRFSPSKIKSASSCSFAFYAQEFLKIPQKPFARTNQGSMCHSIIEYIMDQKRPKRVEMFKEILKFGFKIDKYPSIKRYVRIYDYFQGISPYEMSDIEGMIDTFFLGIRSYFYSNGEYHFPKYLNEYEFNIDVQGAHLKGFIDLLLLYDNKAVIVDAKSQRQRFTNEELTNNIQAAVYELAVWIMFKKPSSVTFILLRHPPTKRTPDKHLQVFGQKDETFFSGLEEYIKFGHSYMNNFGIQEATLNFKADHDKGFCLRVCQFRQSVDYVVELDKDGDPVKGFFPEDVPDKVPNGHRLEARRYNGCLRFGGTIPI